MANNKNKNDITLDTIVSGIPSKKFLDNYDRIDFRTKLEVEQNMNEASAVLTMVTEDDGSLD